VEVQPAPDAAGGRAAVLRAAVAAAVVPGGAGQEDDKLSLPSEAETLVAEEVALDGVSYVYFSFPSETVTRSGYQARRRLSHTAPRARANAQRRWPPPAHRAPSARVRASKPPPHTRAASPFSLLLATPPHGGRCAAGIWG